MRMTWGDHTWLALCLSRHLVVAALLCVGQAPWWRRKASFAEGVEAWQQFGLPAVEAELTQGTDVQQAQAALLFWLGLLDRLALCLVFHNDHNVVRFQRLPVFLHGLETQCAAGYYNFLITVTHWNNTTRDSRRLQQSHAGVITEALSCSEKIPKPVVHN